ncbi:hypothetical protein [Streptomyces sp. S8]|uniref:hypothetical protein n=1 Tax=Streptomyces sp. S8 TaxID=1837283 RepID=UPI00131B18A0|nr:hypothetical protein [Streptomyces sp. S8]
MPVAFRIRCCLCAKNIPLRGDVIALDGEWQRRYSDMVGTLACERCVIDRGWNFVAGHIAAPEDQVDVDSWSHHLDRGTHRALVNLYPRSGMLQGAEPYLRWLAVDRYTLPEVAARLREALEEFDARAGRSGAVQLATA